MKKWRQFGHLLSVLAIGTVLGLSQLMVLPVQAAPLTPEERSGAKADSPHPVTVPSEEAIQTVRTLDERSTRGDFDEARGNAEPETRQPSPAAPAAVQKPAFAPVYVDLAQRVAVRRPVALRGKLASRGGRPFVTVYERRVVPVDISPIILKHASLRRLDPHLVKAVICVESQFRNSATSWCGAAGLMQLMPTTGYAMGARDLYNPEQNIAAGTRYLRLMLDMYGGNLTAAVAAYNAGPGNVPKSGAIPNITETRNYVKKVMKAYRGYKREAAAGVED